METELLVEALGSNLFSLVEIDKLPSLVSIVILVVILLVNNDSLAFFVLSIANFNNSVISRVHKSFSLELEDLEPSRVG